MRVVFLLIVTVGSTAESCRYDINGFVEELPKLPEKKAGHACAAVPATGVRPAQPILTHRLILWSVEQRMEKRKAFVLLC